VIGGKLSNRRKRTLSGIPPETEQLHEHQKENFFQFINDSKGIFNLNSNEAEKT